MPSNDGLHEPSVLTSWKEVAAYFGKGVRTVQRWEKYDGLPVRRLSGSTKIIVHRHELDHWLRSQAISSSRTVEPIPNPLAVEILQQIEISKALRAANHELRHSVNAAAHELIAECRRLANSCTNVAQVPPR